MADAFSTAVKADPGPEPSAGVTTDGPLSFATGGDRASLRLHEADERLILAVAGANPRTVVAVVAGSAVIMSAWASQVPAIVQSWYAGMEGGHALADVLLGHRNAEGRLPFTVPVSREHLPHFERETESITYDRWHGWWKFERDGVAPQFPFGFGLSYTRFEWGRFSAEPGAEAITLRGSVHNRGDRGGTEVVQVYGRPGGEAGAPRLMAFTRVESGPGETADVAISIPLARWNVRNVATHRWDPPSGLLALEIGRWAGDPDSQSVSVSV